MQTCEQTETESVVLHDMCTYKDRHKHLPVSSAEGVHYHQWHCCNVIAKKLKDGCLPILARSYALC